MPDQLTFDALKAQVASGTVDTVLVCFVDMQGRLTGKRFHAANFVEHSHAETHCCNYLLATDLEMATPDGYKATSWQQGYGDYVMRPDLNTLRPVPWLEGTVMVLCDVLDHHTHAEVPHSPRAMLKRQIARLAELGFDAMMATELEFFPSHHRQTRDQGNRMVPRPRRQLPAQVARRQGRQRVPCASVALAGRRTRIL